MAFTGVEDTGAVLFSRRSFIQLVGASAGLALAGTEFLSQTLASATPLASLPNGSNGIEHIVVLMMENRSFDHFLSWIPGADGKNDLTFLSYDGNTYPNYPLAPDYQGCGYSDPDHSWVGFLLQSNGGKNDGFLQDPTGPAGFTDVVLADSNTFPIGYYTNLNPDGTPKLLPDLPVIGALAQNYTTLDRYFCSFAGETIPNRIYQHAGQTDRDRNDGEAPSTLPTIWDQLSPVANTNGVPTGGYYYRDTPMLALWNNGVTVKYQSFLHPFADGDPAPLSSGTSFIDACANGTLPNVCYIDPSFDDEGVGTSGDDHPVADIRLGERFIADAYHALADNGLLDNTVFIVTFDEWGGFYDHVPPPHVVDDTDPANVNHEGNSTTPTDGQLVPDYTQLGFRVPAIVVSNLMTPGQVVHAGPFEHCSSLALIESTFGLTPLTARDTHAENLNQILQSTPVADPVSPSAIPTSSQVIGPAISKPQESDVEGILEESNDVNFDPAATCEGGGGARSVSPAPINVPGAALPEFPLSAALPGAVAVTTGMVAIGRHYRKQQAERAALAPEPASDPAVVPSAAPPLDVAASPEIHLD
jgi:phospholipase C